MCPKKQNELLLGVFFIEHQNKPHESEAVETKRQKSMLCDEEPQSFKAIEVNKKVFEKCFAVEEIICSQLKVIGKIQKSF